MKHGMVWQNPLAGAWKGAGWTVLALVLGSSGLGAQCIEDDEQQLVASDAEVFDALGRAVALDGDVAVVGAPDEDEAATTAGAAYVFRFDGSSWVEEQKLMASDAAVGDQFGHAVAVHEDVVLVAAPWDDDGGPESGSVYAFRYDGTQWVERQKLTALNPADSDRFGFSVAVGAGVIVVGALEDDDGGRDAGAAYVFRDNGTIWVQVQKLVASDAARWDSFGRAVAVHGNVVVVGAPLEDDGGPESGAVYVFRGGPLGWREEQKLVAGDARGLEAFGLSVSVSGEVILVGAHVGEGAAYVFRHDGTLWVEEQKLTASDGAPEDQFGRTVSVHGSGAVIGAPWGSHAGKYSGSAYVFRDQGDGWVEEQKLSGRGTTAFDVSGWAVAASADWALVGTPGDDDAGESAGAAHVFLVADLALEASPEEVSPGDVLAMTTCGGHPGDPALLALVDFSGTPLFMTVATGVFDANGQWTVSATVPPGLSGNTAGLRAFGFHRVGKVGSSRVVQVTFR